MLLLKASYEIAHHCGGFALANGALVISVFLCDSVPAPSVSADNSQVGLGEVGGEDNEVDGGVAIKTVLAQLGLESLTENFQKEQIDLESLVSARLVADVLG